MKTKEDFLFRRGKSGMYYARFQYPDYMDRAEWKFSLKTKDRKLAEARIAPYVIKHKALLAVWASMAEETEAMTYLTTVVRLYEEGEHTLEDGTRVIVTQGAALRCNPGGKWEPFENEVEKETDIPWTAEMSAWQKSMEATGTRMILAPDLRIPKLAEPAPAPKVAPKESDELAQIVETWITEKQHSKHIANEVRGVLAIWSEISGGKALRDCGRADGVKLREHLFSIGNKLPTVQKKLGHLRAAIRSATLEERYNGPNPFTALVTKDIKKVKKRYSIRGRPFTEDDMAKVRASLADWNDPDTVLLWVLCATTGMRRSEAFLIDGEEVLAGNLRTITLIPTNDHDTIKNDESKREIPIPADAIPFLPARITGRLFEGKERLVGNRWLSRNPVNIGKRLLRRLEDLGVLGPGKDLKSTRHRAARRMKNARLANGSICQRDLRRQILGHKFQDVHDEVYANGYPQDMLKEWIDVIGLGPTDRTA